MDDGLFLQSVEALGDSPFVGTGGEIWEWLQGEKEEVSQELLAEGPLCHSEAGGLREHEASETNVREIEWRHRGHLEARLRDISDAQDRLIDGGYGKCADCRKQIDSRRLVADPSVSLCLEC
ncbi:MAG: TraR/DksA C4-type zinc finger protein, partial [Pyrinomonadaceae bacterium]|nr:TraR/DksA C4-type zinc finger protein [Pyrinomonadaceae bacterium]